MATKKPAPYMAQPADALDFEAVMAALSAQAPAAAPAAKSGVMRRVLGDGGISLLKGAIGVPEAAVGLADIATGGRVGKFLENEGGAVGFRPDVARKMLDEYLTPEQQAANAAVQQAEGFTGKLGAAVTNPSTVATTVAESLPLMLGGAGVARGLMAAAPRMGAVVAGAAGEGITGAGSAAEQIRQETPDGLLTAKQAGLAAASGAATGALSVLGGKVAQRLGIGDVDTLLAQAVAGQGMQRVAAQQTSKGLVRKVLEGAVSEGVLEELPQSIQEQVLQNAALNKPLDEGVDYAAVMGLLSGAAMGGVAAPLARPGDALRQDKMPEVGPMTRSLNAAVEAAAQKVDAGAPIPADPATAAPAAAAPVTPAAVAPAAGPAPVAPLQPAAPAAAGGAPAASAAPAEQDPMYEQALAVVQASGKGSISEVQRHLRIGYNRAARLLEQMELAGVLTPMNTAGQRTLAQAAPNDAARAQREADKPAEPTGMVQDGDILNAQGRPFKSMDVAMRKLAEAGGEDTHEIKRVRGGLVVRPKAGAAPAAPVEPAVDTTAAAPAGEAPVKTEEPPSPEAPSPAPAAPRQFNLDGKTWTLNDRTDTALTVVDGDGQTKRVPAGGKLGQRITAALAETGEGAPAAAPKEKGTPDGQEEEGRLLTPGAGEASERGARRGIGTSPATAQQQASIDAVPPAPRTVTVGGEQVALTPEQGAEWDRVEGEFKQKFADAQAQFERDQKAGPPDNPDVGYRSAKERHDATRKALGFQLAAERRRITGKLTPKEQKTADQAAARIRTGDTVETPQGTGTVTGVAFGKVRAEVDGKTVAVPYDDAKKVDPAPARQPAPAPAPELEVTSSQQPLSDAERDELDAVLGRNSTVEYKNVDGRWRVEGSGNNLPTPVRAFGSTKPAALRNLLGAVRQARDDRKGAPPAAPEPSTGSTQMNPAPAAAPAAAPAPARGPNVIINRLGKDGLTDAERAAGKAPYTDPPAAAPAPAAPSANTLVTDDAAERARAIIRAKLRGNTLNSGIDPELLQAGITLAAYHVERGARKFAAYARAMVDDMGDSIKPYLQSWYMAMRNDPSYAALKGDMDKASAVEDLDVDEVLAEAAPAPAPAPAPAAGNGEQQMRQNLIDKALYDEDPVAYFKAKVQAAETALEALGYEATETEGDLQVWDTRADDEVGAFSVYQPLPKKVGKMPAEARTALDNLRQAYKAWASAETGDPPPFGGLTALERELEDEQADSGPPPAGGAAQNATKENPDDQPTQPPVDSGDQGGSGAPGRERGARSQQRDASADPGDVEGAQPGNVGEPDGGAADQPAGEGAAGPDVGPAGGTAAGGNAGDGRPRAGRKGAPAAGAGSRGGRKAAAGAGKPVDPATVSPANTGPGDFVIADPLRIVGGGQVARFDKNKAAIELRNRLVEAGRAPTREEQEVLAGYTGWGSFGQELFQGTWERPAPKKGWEERDGWLRDNLGRKEWEGMQTSIINAHYTDPPTVMAMWDMVRRMGFTGGRTLEPSIGIGNFYGLMPADMTARSQRAGIELDPMTGSMAQMLYPQANIQIKGYEESTTPDNFYDLVIGNWPFFEEGPADRRYNRLAPTLHDYFFLKAIDQTKPGGLIVGITTKGTMDKKGVNARMEMARKAELVAAFRLPTGAFEEYAGTKVVTDIIILRKRERPTDLVSGAGWIDVKDHDTAEGTKVPVNEYFHRHPDHVIGKIDFGHGTTTFRPGLIVHRPDDMMGQLRRIVDLVPEGAFRAGQDAKRISYVANHTSDRTNSLVKTDKGLFIVQGEYLAPANEVAKYELKDKAKTEKREQELAELIDMRRLYAQLIDADRKGDAEAQRAALRKAYDAFVKKTGPLAESFGLGYLRKIDDPFYPSLAALEIGTEGKDGKRTYRPAVIMSQSTMRGAAAMANPGITDAFVLARNQVVNPPLSLIAEIAKKPEAEVKKALIEAGASFELPNGDFVPSDVYLSGNVREKLREAQAALQGGNAAMQRNVDALKGVLPATIPYYKIETQMGATWVPASAYEQYVAHMLGMKDTEGIKARFENGGWKVDLDGALNQRPQASSGAGVPHVKFKRLVRAAISNQTINIKRKDSDGKEYLDEDATKETNAAIADMRLKFGEWLWSDPTRRVELEAEYNEVRNAYATPRFDGTFLGFQGMALSLGRGPFNLRQHQANAIWRALVTRKSLNAHEVGTGKTFTMGGIAVESRRYGIAKKPLILAHNANSKSVAAEIQQMYPAAKILYVDNLSKENVKTRMMQIANDDWDAVVVPHSLIDRLGFKEDTLMGMAKEEIADLEIAAEEAATEDGVRIDSAMWDDEEELKKLRSPTAKQLVKQRLKIINTIRKLAQQASKEDSVAFEDLGVDMVMVDEAHEFKKPPIATKMKMKGLQVSTSDRSIALMFMTKYIRAMNGGANVHLFTGTPITNTMTEVFHMMRYMMQEEMQAAAIADWDGWFGSFAREVNDVELNPAGEYEAVTRLQSFINVPELRRMIGQYMDVVFAEDMPEMQLRTVNGKRLTDKDIDDDTRREILEGRTENALDRPYKKVVNLNSDMDPAQLAVFEKVQRWARSWRNMTKKQRKDAMSTGAPESPIIHEGIAARASFDVRLVDAIANAGREGSPELEPHPDSKPARALKNLLEIYRGHPDANQVVFMDQGIAKTVTRREGPAGQKRNVTYPAFSSAYDMIERLVQAGIPREQIALVDGSTSKDKRKEVADAMNSGKIRIVFGSSDSLGVGVNMQRNLRAMHHLDAPWMPGELEQRNGRGHRQGNQWNTVFEFRYLTDRLDGRRWQVLAIKQKFITDFMKAKGDVRVIEGDAADDSGGDILSTFSEAAGDPRLLLREKYKKKLEQLQSRERIHGNAVADARREVDNQDAYIGDDERELERLRKAGTRDAITALIQRTMGDGFTARIGDQQFTSRKDAQDALKLWAVENIRKNDRDRKLVGEFGGQPLYLEWRYVWSDEPSLVMEFPGKVEVVASPSWQSLEAQLRQRRDTVEESIVQRLAERREKLAHAKKVAVEPFHMADKLQDAKTKLADLESDIARNPVAPPYWLRAGAPMDTDVIYNGKTFTVVGHRWSDTGYYVVGADERGELPIPYMEARDSQGMPMYEERAFKPPVVVQANGAQAVPSGGMKLGDAYQVQEAGGAWRVLNGKGDPYTGQPADGFPSKAQAQLWADTRPDPTAPADVDAQRIASIRAEWERDNGPAPVFSRPGGPNRGVPMTDAKAVVATIRQALPTAPTVHLLETLNQAPKALRDTIKAQGAEDLEAAYHHGEIYVFPRNIASIERMQFVVGHHEVRHHGIRMRLGTGDELGAAMHAMWAGNQALRKAAQAKLDAGLANSRALAVEEALADMPAEDIAKFKGWPRLVAAIRQWLRQVAAKLRASGMAALADAIEPKTWTDADVARFVLRAEDVSRGDTSIMRAGGTVFAQAFHGTPYRGINKFSTDAIGTGEGAQAYGWGLYFASKREVAEHYRKTLAGADFDYADQGARDRMRELTNFDDWIWRHLSETAENSDYDKAKTVDALRAYAARFSGSREAIREIAGLIDAGRLIPKRGGQLYEVAIPEDGELLLWDKPMAEQPEQVRKALSSLGFRSEGNRGSFFYQRLADLEDGQKAASQALLAAGVRGIKYLDGMSRDGKAGTFNYVIFSGDDVAITGTAFSRPGITLDGMREAVTARNVAERFDDLTRTAESFNWWHKTVGTQFHKAKTNPLFRRVYDKAQDYLHDTSAFANDPAALAGDLLPQLRTLGDMRKRLALKKADADNLARAVFGGTLTYTRDDSGQVVEAGPDDTAGVVFTPAELRDLFGFTDEQVVLYQQARAATDRSLDILAAADVARLLGEGLPAPLKAMISAGDTGRFKGLVTSWLGQQRAAAEKELADVRRRHRNEMANLNRRQKAALEGAGGRAGTRLANLERFDKERRDLKFRQGGEKYRAEQEAAKWVELDTTIKGKYERIDQLKAQGYAPLMRFGRYTVDVLASDGSRVFFGMFETEREANAAARQFREQAAADGDDTEVTQGIMSEQAYKQFSGMTPETLELFAEVAGVEKNSAFEQYLRLAKNNRSALKRLIKRQGIAGFSQDTPRVLAAFLTSNARAASSSLHLGELSATVEEIPKEAGDVKDEAIRLREYVQNPQEEAQGIRSLLFAQYLGGSVASAVVNMTQPLMMTFPYLSQFGGPVKAAGRMLQAVRQALGGVDPKTELGRALKLAEKEGITAPQELHQLQAEASRTLGNNPSVRRLMFAWGGFFALAEQFNRRVSFIAAFNTAKEQKIDGAFSFAASTVDETQGVYNKANRPNWARGAVGATVFTFKQYSISYVEFLKRLPTRERTLALAILILAAGAQGLPGADDLDDLIDTVGQHAGYDVNAKLWKTRVLNDALGEAGADFVLHGFSALPGFPLDVSGRLGLGNLIPGTGLLLKSKTDKSGEVAEAVGPLGSTVVNTVKAIPALLTGDLGKANAVAGPVALKNLGKAVEMYQTGQYRDGAGRKVVDVTAGDALVKAIGFQPAEVARDSRMVQLANQQVALARNVESEIAAAWAQGVVDKEPEKVAAARQRLIEWNQANPQSRIAITPQQIRRRVRDMRLSRDERFVKAAPKEMRATVREAVQ